MKGLSPILGGIAAFVSIGAGIYLLLGESASRR